MLTNYLMKQWTVKAVWCLSILLMLPIISDAATYYVSSGGNDANDGLSESTPWNSLSKVNAAASSGSTVLFRRGDVFRGQIELAGTKTGVTFGAYGTGENPVISGSVEITGWTVYKDRIYVADVSGLIESDSAIKHLFVNGELMTIARYPNSDAPNLGWLEVGTSTDKKTFTDPALAAYGKPAGYWNGANVRIRTFSWLFEIRTVSDYQSNGTITMDKDLTQTIAATILPGWGYYLDNKLDELDHDREWYFDPAAKKVYLWAPDGKDPNTMRVEGSTYPIGIKLFWHEHDCRIENLTFRHQTKDGVQINQCDRIQILNCRFEYCGEKGINMAWNSVDMAFKGNTFENMLDYAVVWNANIAAGNSVIESNTIRNTAMIPGYGGDGVTHSIAIRVFGTTGLQIRRNLIENTGYVGMILEGGSHIVENNIIRRSLLTLDDGGAILVNSNNNQIRNNYIAESIGNRDVSSGLYNGKPFRQMGMGIFFQPKMSDNVIEGNTIADNTDFGIYPDRAIHTVIRNNVCYNNRYQVYLKGSAGDVTDNQYGNTIEGNILYSLSADQVCMRTDAIYDFGTFDKNWYCNPFNENVIAEAGLTSGVTSYSLSQWQAQYPLRDPHSKASPVRIEKVSDPKSLIVLFSNTADAPQTFGLGRTCWFDVNGQSVSGSITLQPFESAVLTKDTAVRYGLVDAVRVMKVMIGLTDTDISHLDMDGNKRIGLEDGIGLLQIIANQ